MAVEVTTPDGFNGAMPRALFSVPASVAGAVVQADGRRFLFAKTIREESTDALTFVQNWPALLTK
jgi:hypothetical protein